MFHTFCYVASFACFALAMCTDEDTTSTACLGWAFYVMGVLIETADAPEPIPWQTYTRDSTNE